MPNEDKNSQLIFKLPNGKTKQIGTRHQPSGIMTYTDWAFANLFVIMSESEYGFWSNDQGWVYDTESATFYLESEQGSINLPQTRGNDARFHPLSRCANFDPEFDPEYTGNS